MQDDIPEITEENSNFHMASSSMITRVHVLSRAPLNPVPASNSDA
jgi:hypothetical protein